MAIGWQLFYEGVWKIKTLKSPAPWTAAGYLKNSQGPLRGMFRNMAGDADDLDWLSADKVINKWDDWKIRFASHYKLDNGQLGRLNQLLDGSSEIAAVLKSGVPEKVDLTAVTTKLKNEEGKTETVQIVTYDAEKKQLRASGKVRFEPREKMALLEPVVARPIQVQEYVSAIEKLYNDSRKIYRGERPSELTAKLLQGLPDAVDLSQVTAEIPGSDEGSESESVQVVTYDAENQQLTMRGDVELTAEQKSALTDPVTAISAEEQEYLDAVDLLYRRSANLSYKQRVRALLVGNADNAGIEKQQKVGEIEKYTLMLDDYERRLANASQDYQYDHLSKLWDDIQAQRASLVGPIKALDADLKKEAQSILTVNQLKLGSVPEPWTSLRFSDTVTILGLACLGIMLIVGLFTRFAATMAAIMLFSFYMAMPPLPGLPELPGPEHSLIVNKNLIEVFALLAIAALPTGLWFGLDSFIAWFFAGSNEK
jgi:uncharacterized membrane protein YphA (DoxX/SURF4 family)